MTYDATRPLAEGAYRLTIGGLYGRDSRRRSTIRTPTEDCLAAGLARCGVDRAGGATGRPPRIAPGRTVIVRKHSWVVAFTGTTAGQAVTHPLPSRERGRGRGGVPNKTRSEFVDGREPRAATKCGVGSPREQPVEIWGCGQAVASSSPNRSEEGFTQSRQDAKSPRLMVSVLPVRETCLGVFATWRLCVRMGEFGRTSVLCRGIHRLASSGDPTEKFAPRAKILTISSLENAKR